MKNKNVDFSMFLYLLFSCVLLIVGIAILASFIAPIIFFFRNGIFDYRLDTFIFSCKAGIGAGIPLGVGIWVFAKIEELKKKK
ncbi:Uncharacterised protein [Serratia proteamaculans]|uniref:hypothetical protein n=1 Tax=Serratia proteamaculans TaxID=28151 RepID=UPI0021790B48|nr:hypothetical protein [Serratia proteamaculans]CAI1757055.1 Uncharacterised protein [Serratia proteamaculans]CAI2536892.1 Uncharacterised protein [Serratia proteamaculans]